VDSGAALPVPAVECADAQTAALRPPVPVHGRCTPWLLLGPMAAEMPDLRQLTQLPGVLMGPHGPCVWRTGYENTALRPYVESKLFGRWTYPLGVTLYGLLTFGLSMGYPDVVHYVRSHLRQVTGAQAYALWDTNRYGFAGINQQLCWLDALDDCGSFGAFMLTCLPPQEMAEARAIADTIADYMMERQPRLSDCTFVRRDDTLWADDLYMSVPFLCRYGVLTGDARYLDECARQYAGFRSHLYMPEKRVIAHMKCMRRNRKNGIPWSRGNGWVLFSLSELMERLPADHPSRGELLQFYAELSQGVLALQDEQGLWHQILDEPDTYREASSTAMFLCALARGIRCGYLPRALHRQAREAVYQAWKGLARHCIDRDGNLYGVCRGSGFSFSRAYYRGLTWNFNDTHGIGIVILAGMEMLRLQRYEREEEPV
jgi:rhamnogalacturonyl hydrolase YesR